MDILKAGGRYEIVKTFKQIPFSAAGLGVGMTSLTLGQRIYCACAPAQKGERHETQRSTKGHRWYPTLVAALI